MDARKAARGVLVHVGTATPAFVRGREPKANLVFEHLRRRIDLNVHGPPQGGPHRRAVWRTDMRNSRSTRAPRLCFCCPRDQLPSPFHSRPHVGLWQQTADWLLATFRRGAPSWDATARLIEHFSSAGLPQPALFSETPVSGGVDAPHYAWLAGVARTLLPQMVETGVVSAETVAINTLEIRLRSAVVEARSQVEGPAQVCAWTRV